MVGVNLLITALLIAACVQVNAQRRYAKRDQNEQKPSQDRFNFFDVELLQKVAQAQPGNVLISPVSIKATLAMLLEGAGGHSADEIRNALRLPEEPTAIQKVFNSYLTSLTTQHPGQTLALSNRVFISKRLSINPSYEKSLRKNYYASVVNVDFSRPQNTANIINGWIQNVTNNLVPSLVEAASIQPDAQVLLANAVYFKGKWLTPFDNEGTVPRCFYTAVGVCRNANMMETLGYYGYAYIQGLDAFAMEIPYEGDQFSMVVVMPSIVDGITQLVRDILHVPLHTIVRSLRETELLVSLPRFEIEFSTDMLHTLQELGIQEIFSPFANLTGLFTSTERGAQVSNVFHKAKIIVNEEGSEAGAGTGALVIPLMGSVIPKFRADRPFLFFLRDKVTGVVLFAGRVNEPEAVKAPQTDEEFIGSVFPVTKRPERPERPERPDRQTTPRPKGPYPKPVTAATERRSTSTTEGTDNVDSYISQPVVKSHQYAPPSTNNHNLNSGYNTNTKSTEIDFNPPAPARPTYANVASQSNQNPSHQNHNSQGIMGMQHIQNMQPVYQQRPQMDRYPVQEATRMMRPPYQPQMQMQGAMPFVRPDVLPLSIPGANTYRAQQSSYPNYMQAAMGNGYGQQMRRIEYVYVHPGMIQSMYPMRMDMAQVQQNTNQNGYHSQSSHQNPTQNSNYEINQQILRKLVNSQTNYSPVNNQHHLTNQRHLQGNAQAGQQYEPAQNSQMRATGGQRTNYEQPRGGYQQDIVFPQNSE